MHLLTTETKAGPAPSPLGAVVLGLFRILIGASFALHGYSELFGKPVHPYGAQLPAFGSWPHWWAGIIELVGGIAVALGLGTRIAALLCSGAMAYAFLTVHLKHGILPIVNGGEPAVLFCWSFFLIAVLGAGAFSADALITRFTRAQRHPAPARAVAPHLG
ncbi:DoxX family protein [Nocardia sp. NBC_01327]|uniref:DoxX family protein n=1 Tax=Nocardia sp. NBC_01327 TaxID=2903593 RepID=UPI002E14F863|nr:DoxX family protein [Nocardia sp. NBC_01327]